jgi:hypothetical protein
MGSAMAAAGPHPGGWLDGERKLRQDGVKAEQDLATTQRDQAITQRRSSAAWDPASCLKDLG